MRFFNTSGPVVTADHYCIPPLERINFAEIRRLIRDKRYFVLHAPRQTGKTSSLLALRDLLNDEGLYRCVYVNVEGGQAMHAKMWNRSCVPFWQVWRLGHASPRATNFWVRGLASTSSTEVRASRCTTGGIDALGRGGRRNLWCYSSTR